MKIISLLENTTKKGFKTEHGLSLYIEANGIKLLFDFGGSELFYRNAQTLGVDLCSIDYAVLSHGHGDHGGGLEKFLEVNSCAKVYISPFAFEPHFNKKGEYIGLNTELQNSFRFVFVENKIEIARGITVFNCNSLLPITEINHCGHTSLKDGRTMAEDYCHEQYLLIEEGEKRVLISGCSHKGIINIMEWVKPTHLIGGFHLSSLPLGNELLSYAKRLDEYEAEYYTCHCTGLAQFEFMKNHMKRLSYLACGEEITI